jgi:hypothetical protein
MQDQGHDIPNGLAIVHDHDDFLWCRGHVLAPLTNVIESWSGSEALPHRAWVMAARGAAGHKQIKQNYSGFISARRARIFSGTCTSSVRGREQTSVARPDTKRRQYKAVARSRGADPVPLANDRRLEQARDDAKKSSTRCKLASDTLRWRASIPLREEP